MLIRLSGFDFQRFISKQYGHNLRADADVNALSFHVVSVPNDKPTDESTYRFGSILSWMTYSSVVVKLY